MYPPDCSGILYPQKHPTAAWLRLQPEAGRSMEDSRNEGNGSGIHTADSSEDRGEESDASARRDGTEDRQANQRGESGKVKETTVSGEMVCSGNHRAPGRRGDRGWLADAFDSGCAGNAHPSLRRRRVGRGGALCEAGCTQSPGNISRNAGNKPGSAEVVDSGTVETVWDALRAWGRVN